MSTLLQVYQQVCTEDLIPLARRKDVLTAVRYLAAAHDSSPEHLALTPEIEATYRDVLRHYLTAQDKGPSTIRNSIQGIGQFLKACHQVTTTAPVQEETAPVPMARPRRMTHLQSRAAMNVNSPYSHQTWLARSRYVKPIDQWPSDLRTAFERYRRAKKDRLRSPTMTQRLGLLEAYVGYLSMAANERLDYLPEASRKKLMLKRYTDDVETITTPPVLTKWPDLFVKSHAQSFVTWHAWRIHTASDAMVQERPPSMPSTRGRLVVGALHDIAATLKQKEANSLSAYLRSIPPPRKIHNKAAADHVFSFAELEGAALALMAEARGMEINNHRGKTVIQYPGSKAASHFQIGLIIMLGWRIPMRARNWCEALLDTNLRHINGKWFFHFEGNELKVSARRGRTNVYEMEVPPEVVPYLEEYLQVWRLKLPRANEDRHVFLRGKGGFRWWDAVDQQKGSRDAVGEGAVTLNNKTLLANLKFHVYRHTGKRFFSHLFRTIFTSNMLNAGMDINSVAYGLNDHPATVLKAYNELQGNVHQQNLQAAYTQALHGNGHSTSNGKGTTP